MSDKELAIIERELNNLIVLHDDFGKAERCGIDCDERKERAGFLRDFFTNVKREYFGVKV
jgi:hypothetical protein